MYQAGSTLLNYFAGPVGAGVTPAANVGLKVTGTTYGIHQTSSVSPSYFEGYVGIGVAPNGQYQCRIDKTGTAQSGMAALYMAYGQTVSNDLSAGLIAGLWSETVPVISNNLGNAIGHYCRAYINSNPGTAKTVGTLVGAAVDAYAWSGAGANLTISYMTGLSVAILQHGSSAATITNKRALFVAASSGFSGTVYGIWQDGATDHNYLKGYTGVGVAPSASYSLRAPTIQCTTNFYNSSGVAGASAGGPTSYSVDMGATTVTIRVEDGLVTQFTSP
jgi:hypothetical protein